MLFVGTDKTVKEILEPGKPRPAKMLRFSSLKELNLPKGLVDGPERMEILSIKHRARKRSFYYT